MKKNHLIKKLFGYGLIIIPIVLLLAYNFSINNKNTDTSMPRETIPDAQSAYISAVSNISANDMAYQVEICKEIFTDSNQFSEQIHCYIKFSGLESENFYGYIFEEHAIGKYTYESSEAYTGNQIYTNVNGSLFTSDITKDQFISRYIPLIIINANNYNSISGYDENDTISIEFSDPNSAEQWITEEDISVESAYGTVTLDKNNALLSSSYTIQYTASNKEIKLTVTTKNGCNQEVPDGVDTTLPYTFLTDIDAPKRLETACGYLMQASNIQADYNDYINCTAFGDHRTQIIKIESSEKPNLSASVYTTITLTHGKQGATDTTIEKEEHFRDGIYTIQINDGQPTTNDSVTADTMSVLCRDILLGTLMLPEHIMSVEIAETDDQYQITFSANEIFSDQIKAEACNILYQNPNILSEQTANYTTSISQCYLIIDKQSGIPMASGYHYLGIYEADGLSYQLEFQADQKYNILVATIS